MCQTQLHTFLNPKNCFKMQFYPDWGAPTFDLVHLKNIKLEITSIYLLHLVPSFLISQGFECFTLLPEVKETDWQHKLGFAGGSSEQRHNKFSPCVHNRCCYLPFNNLEKQVKNTPGTRFIYTQRDNDRCGLNRKKYFRVWKPAPSCRDHTRTISTQICIKT